uniref:DUF4329 domain-containing protein n=1 Tax=Candidatus Kentrum sp. UNK TaxID=2126344 RepID=A0A451AER7_9GAMM|nr:MAG: protein of unknown function (DUF4329) [Candidatus Kentron sp. UNK]VFK71103.1 MAG: protein of unknown function (DUF4329) [Candidatus Kentron sp. UNK]
MWRLRRRLSGLRQWHWWAEDLPGQFVGGAAAGFVAGGISTGTWKGAFEGAVLGGVSGGIAFGIGHGFGASWGSLGKTVAHGVAQGGLSELAGGDFRSGFLGGMIGHGVGGWSRGVFTGTDAGSVIGRTMAAAVAGGASAKLGGGKFANGAMTGAFAHLFSNEAKTLTKKFSSQHDAARDALNVANPSSISEGREYGGMVYKNPDGTYSYAPRNRGTLDSVDSGGPGSVPSGTKATAYYHTHGSNDPGYDNEVFSPLDVGYANHYKIDGYLGTPGGSFKHYDHATRTITELGRIRR